MAIVYKNDLKYNRSASLIISDLISVYNPNVLLFYSTISSAETEATAEVVITGNFYTCTFDAIFIEKDGSGYQFRLDLSNILASFLDRFTADSEQESVWVNEIGDYQTADSMFDIINIDITVSVSGSSDDTDDFDLMICRSVNQFGAEGGSNLYAIYSLDTIPTYHVWSGQFSQFGIFLRNPDATTYVTFPRAVTSFNRASLSPGFYPCFVSVDMTDQKEKITDGNPFAYTIDGSGFYPKSWTPYGTRDANNYFDFVSGNMIKIYSTSQLTHIGFYQDILTAGRVYNVEIVVYYVASGGIRVKDESLTLNEEITSAGTYNYTFIAPSDGKFYIQDLVGTVDVTVQSVSVTEDPPLNQTKQEVPFTITDDSDTRDALLVIHEGCEDGINVRYLSRKYGLLQIQFNKIYQENNNTSEVGRILRNIDDMADTTSLDYVYKYKSEKSIECVYVGATVSEQLAWMEIYSSPFVEVLINDLWVRVFPSGSHSINYKKSKQNMNFTFKFSDEFTQSI